MDGSTCCGTVPRTLSAAMLFCSIALRANARRLMAFCRSAIAGWRRVAVLMLFCQIVVLCWPLLLRCQARIQRWVGPPSLHFFVGATSVATSDDVTVVFGFCH